VATPVDQGWEEVGTGAEGMEVWTEARFWAAERVASSTLSSSSTGASSGRPCLTLR